MSAIVGERSSRSARAATRAAGRWPAGKRTMSGTGALLVDVDVVADLAVLDQLLAMVGRHDHDRLFEQALASSARRRKPISASAYARLPSYRRTRCSRTSGVERAPALVEVGHVPGVAAQAFGTGPRARSGRRRAAAGRRASAARGSGGRRRSAGPGGPGASRARAGGRRRRRCPGPEDLLELLEAAATGRRSCRPWRWRRSRVLHGLRREQPGQREVSVGSRAGRETSPWWRSGYWEVQTDDMAAQGVDGRGEGVLEEHALRRPGGRCWAWWPAVAVGGKACARPASRITKTTLAPSARHAASARSSAGETAAAAPPRQRLLPSTRGAEKRPQAKRGLPSSPTAQAERDEDAGAPGEPGARARRRRSPGVSTRDPRPRAPPRAVVPGHPAGRRAGRGLGAGIQLGREAQLRERRQPEGEAHHRRPEQGEVRHLASGRSRTGGGPRGAAGPRAPRRTTRPPSSV